MWLNGIMALIVRNTSESWQSHLLGESPVNLVSFRRQDAGTLGTGILRRYFNSKIPSGGEIPRWVLRLKDVLPPLERSRPVTVSSILV
jgi:hypothetical protein